MPAQLCSYCVQMFGRAGRDGLPATTVLLYRPSELKAKCVKDDLKSLVNGKRCIRSVFMAALDSDLTEQGGLPCCSTCLTHSQDPNRLFVYSHHPSQRRSNKRSHVQVTDETLPEDTLRLKRALSRWRATTAEIEGKKGLGVEIIASNKLLDYIARNSSELTSEEKVACVPGLSQRHAASLYAVLEACRSRLASDDDNELPAREIQQRQCSRGALTDIFNFPHNDKS
ncbi:uncharacterized protein LOC134178236 [Corticium candelabrum]|uniref:uncharacterized protein LOC134178236 n=1 Tax=Corticium candelabrum TaxID=121492 RepID=UPI002E25F040|nr:uncharacterized protein LOC134178236 [Corticium candelabrum]